jgi:hypothetical protein
MAIGERSEVDELIHRLVNGATGLIRWCAQLLSPPPKHDPVDELLDRAPLDNEPITDEDAAAIEKAAGERVRGETVSLADIKRAGG